MKPHVLNLHKGELSYERGKTMVNWDSHNPTPPSLVYPPEGQKWHPRRHLAATSIVTAPTGKEVCIGEIRGWLRNVDDHCNDIDPDWHYLLVIDPAWLDAVGIPLELYLLPGDVLANQGFSNVPGEVELRSSARAHYSEAFLVIELDGWPPNINKEE